MTIGLAYLLDLLLGDPPGWPHPVRWIGRLISYLTEEALEQTQTPEARQQAGALIVALTVGAAWLGAWAVLAVMDEISPSLGFAAGVVMAYTALSTRSLWDETWKAVRPLLDGDLTRARRMLSMVVGRDTSKLDDQGVLRAALETLAENLSDGVIAPLFYMAIGGPAMGLAYKAVNTLDSMIGYKTKKYKDIGRAAAYLDDAVNFIPARISALFIVLAARLIGLDARAAWAVWMRDGGRHTSPNAGRPEAAMAGALGVRLGGPSTYFGVLVEKPFIGQDGGRLTPDHVRRAGSVMFVSSGMVLLLCLVVEILRT